MAYRFMSCSACGTRLRFLRRVERPSIECPLCANVMDLVPKDMIPRSERGNAGPVMERIVPEPEVVPQEVIEAKHPHRRSRLRKVFDYFGLG